MSAKPSGGASLFLKRSIQSAHYYQKAQNHDGALTQNPAVGCILGQKHARGHRVILFNTPLESRSVLQEAIDMNSIRKPRSSPAVIALFIAGIFLFPFDWTSLAQSSQSSTIITYAGGSVPEDVLATARAISPRSIVLDRAGGVYFSSFGNRVYRIAPNGSLTLIAGRGAAAFSGDGGPAV